MFLAEGLRYQYPRPSEPALLHFPVVSREVVLPEPVVDAQRAAMLQGHISPGCPPAPSVYPRNERHYSCTSHL
jgi:hypothetical protein